MEILANTQQRPVVIIRFPKNNSPHLALFHLSSFLGANPCELCTSGTKQHKRFNHPHKQIGSCTVYPFQDHSVQYRIHPRIEHTIFKAPYLVLSQSFGIPLLLSTALSTTQSETARSRTLLARNLASSSIFF